MKSAPSILEVARLKRENQALRELIGTLTLEMSLAKKRQMIAKAKATKADLAKEQGIARSSLYYQPKMPLKDWHLKNQIELALKEHNGYLPKYKRLRNESGSWLVLISPLPAS